VGSCTATRSFIAAVGTAGVGSPPSGTVNETAHSCMGSHINLQPLEKAGDLAAKGAGRVVARNQVSLGGDALHFVKLLSRKLKANPAPDFRCGKYSLSENALPRAIFSSLAVGIGVLKSKANLNVENVKETPMGIILNPADPLVFQELKLNQSHGCH